MFKDSFKYFKLKTITPNFNSVYNFNNEIDLKEKVKQIHTLNQSKNNNLFGFIPTVEWKIYELNDKPGLFFIKNPFTTIGQRYWISKALFDFPKKPNLTNIDAQNVKFNENWWSSYEENKLQIKKLRWATLGFHHNWDTKIYSENLKSEFPSDLFVMCQYVANVLDFNEFSAEAAIINYYHMDSTLSGHTDHSEENLDAPLLSFSFGQSAIFLLGGETLEEKPLAMFIHSGDILVMSKSSRLCYHAVPRIIKAPFPVWNDDLKKEHSELLTSCFNEKLVKKCINSNYWIQFENYLDSSRININVRQVLPIGKSSLT